jgi:hypothetical protein
VELPRYVRDLHENPEYLVPLLRAASSLENTALRRLPFRHLNCRPSLRVEVKVSENASEPMHHRAILILRFNRNQHRGFRSFLMYFDLPCLRLVEVDADSNDAKETRFKKDVSFLGTLPNDKRLMLKRGQMSVAVTGVGQGSYTVYGLMSGVDSYKFQEPVKRGDPTPDVSADDGDEAGRNQEEEEEDDHVHGDGECPDKIMYAGDHIAADLVDESLDPTIDPRMYFLTRLNKRLSVTIAIWGNFVEVVEEANDRHMGVRTSSKILMRRSNVKRLTVDPSWPTGRTVSSKAGSRKSRALGPRKHGTRSTGRRK